MALSTLPLLPLVLLATATATTTATANATAFSEKCTAFASSLALGNSTYRVTMAQYVPATSYINATAEGRDASCDGYVPVDMCRVGLTVATSGASEVVVETWLPEDWNGRFLGTGNGGLGGCNFLSYTASHPSASNNGHDGVSGAAFNHAPEVLHDYVDRALVAGVQVGKDVTAQFYSKEAYKTYYIGCSAGGRQGWKAAQAYPGLFDGIVAGAPLLAFNGNMGWFSETLKETRTNTSEGYLTAEDWAAVQGEVLRQCDGLDGAIDGILEDARKCHLHVTPMLCTPRRPMPWPTSSPPYILDGQVQHSGGYHGYETTLLQLFLGPLAETWVDEWLQYVVYANRSWSAHDATEADVRATIELNPYNIQTFDTDLSAFGDAGGKILHWHGQADPMLQAGNSDRYYDAVRSTMKATSAELDDFYRYFRVSGTNHCAGGPGAFLMGQMGGTSVSDDPDDNMLMRIVEWVENDAPPEFVRGTKFVNDTASLGVAFTRKHCKHPAVNVYTGTGNGTDEDGWTCVEE
ncbi:putative feruloyl esterase B-2 [Pleomassaria siparia CBS 279.74]|uniref:Carboxylic ester hydrolase n=1 Tax=Pleomassaria siparia CBS 279.74 TaxID=1314801 RepID=A0A6G1JQY5_9PLEO|nr:putative feruloyl esterase B-2 [Pleomassaria siparia CBS 279.74]